MSFHPLSGGFSSSLLGTADPVKFTDPLRDEAQIMDRPIHGPAPLRHHTIMYTIIIIVISALIFITIVAIFDVIRNYIINYYARLALTDPNSHNTEEDIVRTLIINRDSFISSGVFAL